MRKYLPTPKVTAALVIGVLAFLALFAAESMGWTNLQMHLESIIVLVLAIVAAWLKKDDSSPEDDSHGVPQ